jgi:hypothetical protein
MRTSFLPHLGRYPEFLFDSLSLWTFKNIIFMFCPMFIPATYVSACNADVFCLFVIQKMVMIRFFFKSVDVFANELGVWFTT